MKRVLCAVLILLFLASFLILVPSGTLADTVAITIDKDPELGPCESCYIYEEGNPDPVGYEDPTLSIHLTRGVFGTTSWVAARVKVASLYQFRSIFSGKFGSEYANVAMTLAKKVNAVFAVNGDYYTGKSGNGFVLRQGRQYRNACKNRWYDVMVIDYNGDMHILQSPDNNEMKALIASLEEKDLKVPEDVSSESALSKLNRRVYQGFTFGPGLIIDGVQQKGFTDKKMGSEVLAQRMAIAQVGPLEYLFIASSGPDDKKVDGSTGLTLDEFSDLVASFDGIINAYNLDGGSSSTMVFRTAEKKFAKINATPASKTRPIVDVIYFASAWQPEE